MILDMAGLLKPRATKILIDAIRQKHPDLPIHLHTQLVDRNLSLK